jgi:hypothetical protein
LSCGRADLEPTGELHACPRCRAQFSSRVALVGGGAGRAVASTELEMLLGEPPAGYLARRQDGNRTRLVLRSSNRGVMLVIAPLLAFLLWKTVVAMQGGPWFATPLLALLGVIALWVCVDMALGSEQLLVDPGHIEWSHQMGPFRRRRRLPRAGGLSAETEAEGTRHRVVVRSAQGTLAFGRYQELALDDAEWLTRAIQKALLDAGKR